MDMVGDEHRARRFPIWSELGSTTARPECWPSSCWEVTSLTTLLLYLTLFLAPKISNPCLRRNRLRLTIDWFDTGYAQYYWLSQSLWTFYIPPDLLLEYWPPTYIYALEYMHLFIVLLPYFHLWCRTYLYLLKGSRQIWCWFDDCRFCVALFEFWCKHHLAGLQYSDFITTLLAFQWAYLGRQ